MMDCWLELRTAPPVEGMAAWERSAALALLEERIRALDAEHTKSRTIADALGRVPEEWHTEFLAQRQGRAEKGGAVPTGQ